MNGRTKAGAGSYARDVTIVIPTLNRSSFLIQTTRCLAETGFGGHLLIGDSSNAAEFERTRRAVLALGDRSTVVHRPLPGLKVFECLRELVPLIATAYTLWVGDDDILVPRTLERCARFLDREADYSAAGGVGIILDMALGQETRVEAVRRFQVHAVEQATAGGRLKALLDHYSVAAYSLSRTDQFVKRLQPIVSPELSDPTFAQELLPSCMLVAQGKLMILDELFVVRQVHPQRYLLPDVFDWISQPAWVASYRVFQDHLAREIQRRDGLEPDAARELVKQVFWWYVAQALTRKWAGRYAQPAATRASRARSAAKRLPGAGRFWRVVRSLGTGEPAMSVSTLLRRSSPYYPDFLPIYRAVTAFSGSEEDEGFSPESATATAGKPLLSK